MFICGVAGGGHCCSGGHCWALNSPSMLLHSSFLSPLQAASSAFAREPAVKQLFGTLHTKIAKRIAVLQAVSSKLVRDCGGRVQELRSTLDRDVDLLKRLKALPVEPLLAYPAFLDKVLCQINDLTWLLEHAATFADISGELCDALSCYARVFESFPVQVSRSLVVRRSWCCGGQPLPDVCGFGTPACLAKWPALHADHFAPTTDTSFFHPPPPPAPLQEVQLHLATMTACSLNRVLDNITAAASHLGINLEGPLAGKLAHAVRASVWPGAGAASCRQQMHMLMPTSSSPSQAAGLPCPAIRVNCLSSASIRVAMLTCCSSNSPPTACSCVARAQGAAGIPQDAAGGAGRC